MKLYGHPISGNTHRVQALFGVLGVEFEDIMVDLKSGDHKQPNFLKLNPLGQVPVLVDGDLVLRDSTAIMIYIAAKHDADSVWMPTDPVQRAQVQEWLSTAVNEIQHGPFVVRAIKLFGMPADDAAASAKTAALFDALIEPHLTGRGWLVGETPTIADLACYSYIARVTEGGFDLDAYPGIRAWLARVEQIDGFVPMVRIEDLTASV